MLIKFLLEASKSKLIVGSVVAINAEKRGLLSGMDALVTARN